MPTGINFQEFTTTLSIDRVFKGAFPSFGVRAVTIIIVIMLSTGRKICGNRTCRKVPETYRLCGACKQVGYCNEVCQREDWNTHREMCRIMRKPVGKAVHDTIVLMYNFRKVQPALIDEIERYMRDHGLFHCEGVLFVDFVPFTKAITMMLECRDDGERVRAFMRDTNNVRIHFTAFQGEDDEERKWTRLPQLQTFDPVRNYVVAMRFETEDGWRFLCGMEKIPEQDM